MGIFLTLLVLALVIAFHEFGHFIVAKMFGVEVERFSVGFGKVLLSRRIGQTEYCISMIPLGGYVKFVETEDNPSFTSQPLWRKLLVLGAGPGFNFLLSFLVAAGICLGIGLPEYTNRVGAVADDSPAQKSGLQVGDTITQINNIPVRNWNEVVSALSAQATDKEIKIVLERNGKTMNSSVTPTTDSGRPRIGIGVGEPAYTPVSPARAIIAGALWTGKATQLICTGLMDLFTGKTALRESVGGPIMIVQAGGQSHRQSGLMGLLFFAAILSINLGVFNLLPIPPLDGGLALIATATSLFGQRAGRILQTVTVLIGYALLLLLIVFATYNDIARIFAK